jgi:protein-tyrosine-phosphatase
MAEAFYNHLAKEKALAVLAGTNPASKVEPTVVEMMKELGVGMGNHYPKKF